MELLKRLLFPVILVLLAIGFWSSPQLQQIAAGIAIFLFGMLSLERGFQSFSGGAMERLLQVSTRTVPRSLSFGIVATTLMQSSSLVSVLTISFLSAGLMSLSAGLGVIFGANLGTTTGAWLIAGFGLSISLSKLAMPILVFGVMLLFQPNRTRAGIGHILAGIGFLFLGIDYMKEGFAALQSGLDLGSIRPGGLTALLVYTLFGAIATVIMQSSHATLVLTLTALAAGHVEYRDALALAVGANIGTTITAILGSLGANVAGKRLALGHLLFNLITGAVAIIAMPLLQWCVDQSAQLLGISHDNYTLKLALFHTLFNLLGVSIMVPQLHRLRRWLEQRIPERRTDRVKPQFLASSALETPAAAVAVTQKESVRLYSNACDVMIQGLGWHTDEFNRGQPIALLADHSHSSLHVNMQQAYEEQVKTVYSAIISFISIARDKTTGRYDDQLREIRAADHHIIEAIKGVKHLQRNLLFYIHSENSDMVSAYQQLREQIANVMRAINDVRHMDDIVESRLALDHQMLLTEREREASDARIESLIRQRRISAEMATSLMTDKAYARDVCRSLVKAAQYLFIDQSSPQEDQPENLQLEVAELSDINQKLDQQHADDASSANSSSGGKQ